MSLIVSRRAIGSLIPSMLASRCNSTQTQEHLTPAAESSSNLRSMPRSAPLA